MLETQQEQEFYLIQITQTGSGAQRAFYSKGTAAFFPELKRPGPNVDHSLLSHSRVVWLVDGSTHTVPNMLII